MTSEIDLILERAGKLSADETLTLLQRLTASLRRKISIDTSPKNENKVGLVYGEFKDSGRRMSTEEDFELAEYHINEEEWK
jgi:hypothetical protein